MEQKNGYMRYFTKKSCYPNQAEAMEKIHSALLSEKIVLFEGACGTGKTLSALAPALHVGKKLNKVVIIVTNVHQQMVQFINEARDINRDNSIKTIVFKGKTSMCPDNLDYEECRLKGENTYDLLDFEREVSSKEKELKDAYEKHKKTKDPALYTLRNELEKELEEARKKAQSLRNHSCPRLYEVLRFEGSEFSSWLFSDVKSPEEVMEYAEDRDMCGYELLKKELKNTELLICNFHHVLNADIFITLLKWLEKDPEDIILIFDEAHNIEASARSHSSIMLSELTIEKALSEVGEIPEPENSPIFGAGSGPGIGIPLDQDYASRLYAKRLFSCLLTSVRETYDSKLKFGERNRLGKHWQDIQISDPYERLDILKARFLRDAKKEGFADEEKVLTRLREIGEFGGRLEEIYAENYKKGLLSVPKRSQIRYVADFLSSYLVLSDRQNYYPILNMRRDFKSDRVVGRLELFTCIPKNVTQPLLDSVYSAVLMSATLRPFEMVKSTLGIAREVEEITYGTTFPQERRLTLAVSVPPLFAKNRDSPETLESLKDSLLAATAASPGNVIIYFQSYAEALRYTKLLEPELSVPIFLDEVGVSAQEIRQEFFKIGEQGGKAVLITYLWGTLSEGVDFRDSRGRTVIVVGVGYPALNDRIKAVESAYDTVFGCGEGWEFAVQVPTIRKVRQAMGRVVRSPGDFGVRILLDARYQGSQMRKLGKFSVFGYFPPEESREFLDVTPREVGSLVEEFFANIVPYESENKETEIKKTGKKEPESPASRRPEFGSLAEKL
ncbi:DNA repair helicase [Methanosarcina horonobensis HB-1 = JCM 15518]|uniref:DNA repair helicase n=1 Tax=Methanosarcina horonobensis HB-1 = JCM 15518 TaxID=1434110 RepID=A0A0E3WUG5_9EURY|nr:ATP-dependent DNA helicase [Methanosarcina horonobensis]AKB80285.1 DNA repair helicase [Methanosarcina horonobensis HB-1 = JCM 15518]